MAKNRVGVDIGTREIKFAVKRRNEFEFFSLKLPQNMVQDGRVLMPASMTDFLRGEKKRLKLPAGEYVLALPDISVFCRKMKLPYMPEEQLLLNLPYEFRDYIQQDAASNYYDYAVESFEHGAGGEIASMNIMAATAPKELVDEFYEIFRPLRIKLSAAIPKEMAYTYLLRRAVGSEENKERCILDLGHASIRMHIFTGATLNVSKTISLGCMDIEREIASEMNIDQYLAGTYLATDYEGVRQSDAARYVYSQISIEVMKGINFYRFNNRETEMEDIYFCGGGAEIKELTDTISERVSLVPRDISELMPASDLSGPYRRCVAACGAVLE